MKGFYNLAQKALKCEYFIEQKAVDFKFYKIKNEIKMRYINKEKTETLQKNVVFYYLMN